MVHPIVDTRYGQIKGIVENGVLAWKSVPYAKAPVGNLRFRAPEPPKPWEGVYDGTTFGPAPLQPIDKMTGSLDDRQMEMSEDCLYLNIWSQAADDKKRPVMVWIHGGAFMNGNGSSDAYDGASFAAKGNVVTVTINYRLGVMGFLHLDELDHDYAGSGNCGILDQVQALKWIRENIEAFGGDPDRITIFGESAGAMSVGTLLMMPAAKGLFHQAILQSGAARIGIRSEETTKIAKEVLTNLNLATHDLAPLADLPAEQIMKAAEDVQPMELAPVLDGHIIPEHPETAIAKGRGRDIPMLIGTNKDEHRFFTFFDPSWEQLSEAEIARHVYGALQSLPEKIACHFQQYSFNQELFENVMGFHTFTFPAIKLAEKQMGQGAPVWMYRFDWRSPAFDGGLLACHTMEIPFVFHNTDKARMENLVGDRPDKKLAEQMHQAWIAFAHQGNPNTPVLPNWEPYDTEKRTTMLFHTKSDVIQDPDQENRLIWEEAADD